MRQTVSRRSPDQKPEREGPGAGSRRRRGRGTPGPSETEGRHDEPPSAHADLYAEVTARIVAQLEQGRLPWVQPWGSSGAPAPGLPRNALSGRSYSGINVIILWTSVFANGWPSQGWLTYRQALGAGGQVRKGERGTTIVYADRFVPKGADPRAAGGAPASSDGGEPLETRAIPFLKRFAVFNIAQIDGLPSNLAPEPVALGRRETVEAGERLIAASGVDVRIGGSEAFYMPALDRVQLPPQQAFFDQINFYRTALHELTHATGHASRLGRDQSGRFGSDAYAREELVAEIGSAFLCAALGIVPTVRHADYIGSWLTLLRDDLSTDAAVRGTGAPRGRAVFRAAAAASRAADWLLARLGGTEGDPAAGAAATAPAAPAGPEAAPSVVLREAGERA